MSEKSYIKGRRDQASCDLLDFLRRSGIGATAVGYTEGAPGLVVHLDNAEDAARLPTRFKGFPVRVMTGECT